jgi:hypothetical protein
MHSTRTKHLKIDFTPLDSILTTGKVEPNAQLVAKIKIK